MIAIRIIQNSRRLRGRSEMCVVATPVLPDGYISIAGADANADLLVVNPSQQ
jgi:hypothetical protein